MNKIFFFSLFSLLFFSCNDSKLPVVYESETLRIEQLSENSFVHISYLDIPDHGKIECNGLVYADSGEALVFDTPTYEPAAEELIKWIQEDQKLDLKGVVVNHFHIDCLGGLPAFHTKGIPSYGSNKTIDLATQDSVIVPQNGFELSKEISVGNKKVINRFFGEAHSKDNIVSYFPADNLLFGGCMVKGLGGGKGNLSDANVEEWANTVLKIKEAYPNLNVVVPGHGKTGNVELLDYTIEKFKLANKPINQ